MLLEDKIIGGRHMIVLVRFNALSCVVYINIVCLQLLQDVNIDRSRINADLSAR